MYFVIGYVCDKLEFRLLIFYKGSKFVCKGEVHPTNGREGPEWISLNLALVGSGWWTPPFGRFIPGINTVPIV